MFDSLASLKASPVCMVYLLLLWGTYRTLLPGSGMSSLRYSRFYIIYLVPEQTKGSNLNHYILQNRGLTSKHYALLRLVKQGRPTTVSGASARIRFTVRIISLCSRQVCLL